MIIANKNLPFESIDNAEYIKRIEQADMLHNMGLHTDKPVVQLAKLLYEQSKKGKPE